VRAALRRSIESVTCLFVPRGRTRLAAVRVQFAGSELHRDYLFTYKMPWRSVIRGKIIERHASLSVESPKNAWADTAGDLDLRDPKQAAALAADLEAEDPPELSENPAGKAAPESGRHKVGRASRRRKM
jgi:hypothetical protein